jgi:lipopolysaccharide export system ATP-binding protein
MKRLSERLALSRASPDRPRGASAEYELNMLTAKNLAKSYRGRRIVSNVSITVGRGEAVGLLGRNGAGKTTVFSMIAGLLSADKGSILLEGTDLTVLPLYERARRGISYLPQQPSIFRGLTVEQNILLVLEMHQDDTRTRKRQLKQLLEDFGLVSLRNAVADRLSGGERRRCEIARSLASRPSFLLLDEPFAGVDPMAVNDIRTMVRYLSRRGVGVLVTDHNVRETLALVDRAYIIDSGRVLCHGSTQAVLQSPEVRRAYLGEDFRL